jgi:hypothetical protein
MGIKFEEGEKLKLYEASLQDVFINDPNVTQQVIEISKMETPSSMAIALEMLNSQKVLNFEAKLKHFKKESTI